MTANTNLDAFAKGTERLVDPTTVGSIHFLQQFFDVVPKGIQRAIMMRSTKKAPHMGFIVEPYAFFLAYEIADTTAAAELLPSGFRLAKCSVFADDEPAFYAIMSFFRVHTSAFWGSRAELYVMAEDESTGLMSWVIVDYLSDTISYDRAFGLRGPSASRAVVTTTSDGRVLVDMASDDGASSADFSAALNGSKMRELDERMWIEGNLSVAYGRTLSHDRADTFSLTFFPEEMGSALDVPLEGFEPKGISWYSHMLAPAPAKLACFPYAQHLLSDSPGAASGHASAADLVRAAEAADFDAMKTFEAGSAKKLMAVSAVAAFSIAAAAWMIGRRFRA
ncbi:hypothetical protein [Xiamenia xianingshaonis]|uniref:Uncharacterized protein n=1 Tax=Xiamenia xianingshaonis TaxID=2682776 RepID=A0A9E6MRF4_9ACTN|nr:hypothetical protein [Xiamenia xianingshaonis]NHM13330.1 hypothetical protein [Xiamenia xianingshaonis]QTU84589.1 hypothetical protein J7S26_01260 [Xiamenia xianingshaonis]